MAQVCHPGCLATKEAEAGGSQVQGLNGQLSETASKGPEMEW